MCRLSPGLRRGLASRPPGISSPPAESVDRQHTSHGLAFQGGRVGWLLGSWMSRQRCAGRLGGKAGFVCMDILGASYSEVFSNFCYCDIYERPFYVMRYEESAHTIGEDSEKLQRLLKEYESIFEVKNRNQFIPSMNAAERAEIQWMEKCGRESSRIILV